MLVILTHPSSAKLSALTSCRSPQLIEEGSKNVYADLGCTDADVMQRKASKRSAKPPSELLH